MKILITGGAGFIGGHTADSLIDAGHSVRIFDNLSYPTHLNGVPVYLPMKAELFLGDVRCKSDWEKVLHDVDIVFHFAAYQGYMTDYSNFAHVNTVGTSILYEVVIKKKFPIKKIIIASSQAVYGEGVYKDIQDLVYYPHLREINDLERGDWEIYSDNFPLKLLPSTETFVNPHNQYAVSKYSQENVSLCLGRQYGIPTVCMRYSIVQGARQSFYNAYSGICRNFSLAYLFKKQPLIFEDGYQIRDFINIEDVVKANILVMSDSRADFEIFNVGGDCTYTILEFAELAAQVYGCEFNPILNGEFRYGDARHSFSDVSKLKGLGWEPKYDVRYSLESYKNWLETQRTSLNFLESAQAEMRKINVIKSSRKT